MFKYNSKIFIFIFAFIRLNIATFILSGIKTFNKFLYLSRIKKYYKQNKTKSCSLRDGTNCLFTEKKYLSESNDNDERNNILLDNWNNSFKNIYKYGFLKLIYFYENMTKEYLLKNFNKIDKEQNSLGQASNYLLSFDDYDDITQNKDIYLEGNKKIIIYNQEFIIEIIGKLRLSYDKDISEIYLNQIHEDYPSTTFGIIESKFISISFQGELFICDFIYIKAHDEQSKTELLYLIGYFGNKIAFNKSYKDDKKRNEKWLKIFLKPAIPITTLVIYGQIDIDNISFTFPDKIYEIRADNVKNEVKLINDEDI